MHKPIIAVIVILLALLIQNWRSKNYDYQCQNCGETFGVPVLKAVFSIHLRGSKLVRCPKCGKLTFATAVPKQN
jgi:DNA-directed RNA polymerase subunit RPC12/RpoP